MTLAQLIQRLGVLATVVLLSLSCATTPVTPHYSPNFNALFTAFTDDISQAIFDDAMRWSRANELETGGCFSIFRNIGKMVPVYEAREEVAYRRPHMVGIVCEPDEGMWHTHWQKEDSTSVGCNVAKAQDLGTASPSRVLNLTICGVGRDSVVSYIYIAQAEADQTAWEEKNPEAVQKHNAKLEADSLGKCSREAPASLKRPTINCTT